MTIEIKSPHANDAPRLAALWRPAFGFHHAMDPEYYVPDNAALAAHLEDYVRESLSSKNREIRVAQTTQGEFVGLVTFWEEHEEHFDTNMRRFVVVGELFVAEHARKRGIGESLMAAAEDFARSRGL